MVRNKGAERRVRVRPWESDGGHADQRVDPVYFALLSQLQSQLTAILESGVQVKDLRAGLLDFPARRDGRQVLLCWKVGEDALGFWHETGAGFDGRRPVDEDGPWEEA